MTTQPSASTLPADATAERIVRHFQGLGFPGITEALLVRVRVKRGDRLEIDAAFDRALDADLAPPTQEFFEIRLHGFYSEIRSLAEAKVAFAGDFGSGLRLELPRLVFDSAPVVADDALATGTKYDAMLKLADNANGCAVAILLNDPNSSFFEYLNANTGYNWQQITGSLETAANAFVQGEDLL